MISEGYPRSPSAGLEKLEVTGVRNLASVKLPDLLGTNVFFGDNGAGKTSVLESVFLLGMARSFRSAQIKTVICHEQSECTVYGDWRSVTGAHIPVGITRDKEGNVRIKISGRAVNSVAELAELIPVQVINSESFNLLTGGPGDRRQFLDWGVFHVEPHYQSQWQRFQRCIKQRNSLLRRGKISAAQLATWNREFAEAGELVDVGRSNYLAALVPVFNELATRLSPSLEHLELRYRRGWDKNQTLLESLYGVEKSDREQGYTHVGPQRADLKVVVGGQPAGDTLSRGQQKLAVCALKLAQGQVLGKRRRRSCVYLVDDLPAELDMNHCRLVSEVLEELHTQVFITCVKEQEIAETWPERSRENIAMFHVEHGTLRRSN